MRQITGSLNAHRQMVIDVVVQPAQVFVPGVEPTPWVPASNVSILRGLIDTGAGGTCITRSAARAMGLRPRGKARVGGVSGIEYHNRYRFVLGALYEDKAERGYFWFDEVNGADFRDNDDFDVLIGMDVIGQGDLHVFRSGRFTWELY